MENKLKKEQAEIDALFEKEGLTDEILDRQIALNRKKHELDLSLSTDFVQ